MTADKGEYGTGERPEIIGVTPFGRPVPHLAVSVARAGGTGVLDLGADRASGLAALADVRRWWTGRFGVRVPPGCRVRPGELPPAVGTVLVGAAALRSDDWLDVAGFARGRRLLIEIADPAEAAAVVRVARGLTGEVGLIAQDGELTAFVLLQRLLADADVPVHAAGGIGPHTAAAAVAGGAAGVVLDEQFAFVREMDLGGPVPTRPGSPAAALAGRYKTAGGVVQAVREQIRLHIRAAVRAEPLVSRADPAVVQGPMAQLTDGSAFAGAVAQDGGLPFLSLGLLDGGRVRTLLRETADRLGERPWGAGVLGGAPPELRAEQLAAVRDTGAPYAIIAGGGPAEAAPLEAAGISTYLHVPFPALLGRFLDAGVRKFVFEGGEAGGHVGPYASFPLWDAQVERLMAFGGDAGELSVMFAGGVHDARSAAMVAALAGPLAGRGADIRVLMGTAYLFTPEAVAVGAILPDYQRVALACAGTVLLETAPGHAIRCARTPYVETFAETRRELEQAGTPPQEVRRRLEKLNLGRLRVAGKGLRLNTPVPPARQYAEGLYAMGQVAALRRSTARIAALHEEVTSGGTAFLAARAAEIGVRDADEGAASRADIAIIGMGCVFPGARDADGFWANIVGGVDSITRSAGAERAGVIPEVPLDAPGDGAPIELLSLEVASRALEDAGYADRPFDRSRASVFLAAEDGGDALPGAIAARLDLGGMTCTVGASSLAALDVACKDLLTRSSDMALCGGADLRPGPDGRRPGGTVPGEGVACVVLKRLADAERDGDRIYAIVTSVAAGRRLAMERAHDRAGIRTSSVGLVEADRPEPAAPDGGTAGSVTAQIGHTGCAAGLAGLIKTAYALHTGVLPGPPHPSRPWAARPGERLAGVSEYGSGYAHFHAVLSGYGGGPEPVSGLAAWPAELFLIRGADRAAAHAEIGRLSRLLKGEPRLRDLARTAASSEGPVQLAFVASGLDDLRAKLALAAQARPAPGVFVGSGEPGKVAFLFPGEDGRPVMFTDLLIVFPRLQRLLRLAGGQCPPGTLPPPAAGLAVHRLLTAVGVHPDLAAGHGRGELAALCAAGVIDDTAMIEISAGRAGLRSGDLRSPAFPVWADTAAGPYETEPSELAGRPGAPVRFAEQIEAMYAAGARTFVETGPGRVLTDLVGTALGDRPHTAVSCAAPGENTLVTLLHALAALAAAGAGVDPLPLFGGRDARPLSDVPARPRVLVDGRSVRIAAGGRPVTVSGTPGTARPAEAAVLEYLRTSREVIAAQREAVLRHLAAASRPARTRSGAHVRTAALSGGPAAPAPRDGTPAAPRYARPAPRPRGTDTQVWPSPGPQAVAGVVRRVPRVVELDPLPMPPESGTAFAGRRFLLVDDGCGIALELGDLLERHGAQVRTPPDVDGPCDGLVHLAALRPGAASVLPPAFGAIRQALAGGLRWLVLASGAGGTFGHRFDGGIGDPAPGAGLRGLARTIAWEHPEVLVRALDVDTKDTPRALAQRIMAELLTADAPVVIGHEGGLRYGLELVPSGPPGGAPLNLARDAVVLLTGGERGMTGRLALELARTSGCHIELMGRTPEREIRVDALLEHAASVRYHAGDVRDPRAVRDVVENIYLTHRRLDGVIHGAALAEPRPDGGRAPGSFEDVYLTKVAGACALAQAAGPDLGFFAVLCGADGERGGAGAAAANDACGTLAHVWRRRLHGRVLVAETLIAPDAGAPALLREIMHGDEPHVVLTGEVR